MAKSIRSKWRRKCRAIKRERYGKKELERLKKTLGIDDTQSNNDVNMKDIEDVVNIKDCKTITQKDNGGNECLEDDMETDEQKRKFNIKTLRDQHGTYPVWVHPRKYVKNRKKNKKNKGKRRKAPH